MSDHPGGGESAFRFDVLVRALLADRETVLDSLDDERREALRTLMAAAGSRPPMQVLLELEQLLLWAELPEEHPVSRALSGSKLVGPSVAGSTITPEAVLTLLRNGLGALPAPQPQPMSMTGPAVPAPDPIEPGSMPPHGSYQAVIRRLKALPALSPSEVLAAGADPDLPDLIRLEDDGSVRLPRFQFDPAGAARPEVLGVNRVLGAGTDPWAAASWWTDRHAWLQRSPVELLQEEGGADELGELARAEVTA